MLLWMIPLGLIMAYALWRFFRGVGDRKRIELKDEGDALALTIAADDVHLP